MLKATILATAAAISLSPVAMAQGYDLTGFEPGQGPTLQGPNAVNAFTNAGTNPQLGNNGQQFAQSWPQAQPQAQAPQNANAFDNAGIATAGDKGDVARITSKTGFGPNGYGKNDSMPTWNNKPVMQMTGTQGLARVFGYGGGGGGLISPGGYVPPMLNIPGIGPVRIPSQIGLPGGGIIQVDPNAITNQLLGP